MNSVIDIKDGALSPDILYITESSIWGHRGYKMVAAAFGSVLPIYWSPGMPKPDLSGWRGNWIISFKSDLVLPRALLERAKKGAINFHPCPPKYRGIGGYWWALHNGDNTFGVTCHHMNERIDHGDIIKTESFPILPKETVEGLKHKAALHSLNLLNETLKDIIEEKPLTPCGMKWAPHLYTYKELALAQAQSAFTAMESITTDGLVVPNSRNELHNGSVHTKTYAMTP